MFSRIALLLVTLFWLTMNYLLWRSEFGGRGDAGSAVPVETIWRKILTAPDNSSMEIIHQGTKLGYCRWAAGLGPDPSQKKIAGGETLPEGISRGRSGYRIDFDGNVSPREFQDHIHFNFSIKLATNQIWREFSLRINSREDSLTVLASAAEQKLRFWTGNEDARSARIISFSDLQNPQALIQEFDLPVSLELFGLQGLPISEAGKPGSFSLGAAWVARTDRITIGHASVRAYRLQMKLLDRYQVVVMVSTVGEILRVELPGDWTLVNEQLANY
jgi:hypothetical protein